MTLETTAAELAGAFTPPRPAKTYRRRRARTAAKIMHILRPVFDRLSQAHEDLAEQAIYVDRLSGRRGLT
jgi:hypothetical protein